MAAPATEEKRIEEVLSSPILLSERIRQAVDDADTFRFECGEIGKQVDRLSHMLRSAVRLATSNSSLYELPVRRVVADLSKNLDRALTLVRKCRRRSVLCRVVSIVSAADFRKLLNLLDASIGDMKWLLSIFDHDSTSGAGGGIVLSLPPIASNDPILSWVWSYIASIHMGQLTDRIEAANELASLAQDNDRNKKIIVEEGGIPPLLKLLKENSSPDAQIASATALFNLANDQDRVRLIAAELGFPIIVQTLANSPIRVQIRVANLISRIAQHDPIAQEDFARANVIRPLVTYLAFETLIEDPKLVYKQQQSIHSVVQFNKEMERNSLMSFNYRPNYSGGGGGGPSRKDRENEKPELKLRLKVSCAEALWMLAKGSVSNSRRITETKGLLCLAKIVEQEDGELQLNCLMTIMEITVAAESNADLRRAAFKTNSPAAKAIIDQVLRLINEPDTAPSLRIPAIKSIGALARTFPARETRVLCPLVEQLSNRNLDVATEAAIALGKFACSENFLCVEHSKTIIEFSGVPALIRLLRSNEQGMMHGLVLLCYLALHAGGNEALEQARVLLTTLEGADRCFASQNPELRELVSKAIYHLNLYHTGDISQQLSYSP